MQLYGTIAKTMEETLVGKPNNELDKIGYVNQHGLSRKVECIRPLPLRGLLY